MINELVQFMVDLDMDKFETMLDNYITARGIDKAITQLVFPFLEKIGILWLTNHINLTHRPDTSEIANHS